MNTSNIDKLLFKFRTTHEVEHNDNQWTTEFVYTINEAKQAIQQLLDEAYKKGYIDGGISEITK